MKKIIKKFLSGRAILINALSITIFCILYTSSVVGQSRDANEKEQSLEQESSTVKQPKTSGKILFGLFKWGSYADSISNLSIIFIDKNENFLRGTDSTKTKSILGGAVQYEKGKRKKE